jgi:hypothetical protein
MRRRGRHYSPSIDHIALTYALLHGMRTGHGDGWMLYLGDTDGTVVMWCPNCDRTVPISTERMPRGGRQG